MGEKQEHKFYFCTPTDNELKPVREVISGDFTLPEDADIPEHYSNETFQREYSLSFELKEKEESLMEQIVRQLKPEWVVNQKRLPRKMKKLAKKQIKAVTGFKKVKIIYRPIVTYYHD